MRDLLYLALTVLCASCSEEAPQDIDAWFGFAERYRAYMINYVLGEDLVEGFVREENPDGDTEGDWQALARLLSLPPAPAAFAN